MLVCPDCEGREFTATLTTRTTYTYAVDESGHLRETDSEVVDGGDEGDIEYLRCEDCFAEHLIESLVDEDGERCKDCESLLNTEGTCTNYCA